MRRKLKNIIEADYWVYGITEEDFNYTIRLVKDFINSRKTDLEKLNKEAIEEYPDPDIHAEIISDNSYYVWVDTQYLWQFCLWRLQGIFESLIIYTFLPSKPSKKFIGLKSKLDNLISSGYRISKKDYKELLDWANLRNAISHAPPEQYRPGPLQESDVLNYKKLVERLCKKWRKEQKKK